MKFMQIIKRRYVLKEVKTQRWFFYIFEGNMLGYASYIKIDPMLLHVKNFSTYI